MLLHAKEFTNKLQRTKQRLSTESMGMAEVFDDFGAIANWSMLKPIGKLFSCAAVPLELADPNDAFRIWDKIKTEAINAFANLLPDNLFQSWLMALHLMLLYPHWVGMFPSFCAAEQDLLHLFIVGFGIAWRGCAGLITTAASPFSSR